MRYWLMKSEPSVYPWAQLVADGAGSWDGVRNHQARQNMEAMQTGDLSFFYHSNEGLEIVGIMRITRTAHPDPTDISGKFVQVGVAPVMALPQTVTLKQVKADPKLQDMALVKLSRLSVQPVTQAEWERVCRLGGVSAIPAAR